MLVLIVPFAVFVLTNLFLGKEKRSQTLSTVHFEQFDRVINIFRVLSEQGQNDGVRSLAHNDDFALGVADNNCHSLSSGVEFDDIEELIF